MAALLLVNALWGAPVIREISPRGAQRGKTFKLVLRGESLVIGAEIRTTLPATVSRLVPSKDAMGPGYELPFLVELNADAPIGLYPVRAVTNDGLSNVLLFSVGDLPEQSENESEVPKQLNDTPESAEAFQTPGVMNGTLSATDVDLYIISPPAGQPVVVEVEARRAGSAIDPAIEILDSRGRVVARNDDAAGIGVDSRLEFTPKAGDNYYVRVHDSKYSNQRDNFYRLKVGAFRYAESVFPLGWRRGEAVEASLLGGNLGAPILVKPNTESKLPVARAAVPGSPLQALPFVLSDLPEMLERNSGKALPEATVVNGRILAPGEIDEYKLAVKPGEAWRLELTAASIGTSQLDALLSVRGPDGKTLGSRDDIAGSDPALPFTVPDGVSEVSVTVEDLFGRGGEAFGYRLVAHRGPPDFLVNLDTPYVNVPSGGTATVSVSIQRRGYDGPIRLTIPDTPRGFHVAGGNVPSEADAQSFDEETNAGYRSARAVLTITADPDAKPGDFELEVVATAEHEAGRIERTATGPGIVTPVRGTRQRAFTAPWLGFDLALATSRPLPITLTPVKQSVRIAQGVEHLVEYRVNRRPKTLGISRVDNRTAGGIGNLRVLRGNSDKKADDGYIVLATNFATPTTKIDMFLSTVAEVAGKDVRIDAPAITVEVVPGYQITLNDKDVEIEAGGRAEITGKIVRDPTFEGGLVKLKATELPEQVDCAPLEVAASDSEFKLSCEARADAPPGGFDIWIASEAPDTGKKAKDTYKIPDVSARLKVKGAAQALK